ncbi:MAG: hypothetical protein HQL72_09715 [Magnetococcales bacterium]|nr:hypothetical protein [Magnetococcales bacterium]
MRDDKKASPPPKKLATLQIAVAAMATLVPLYIVLGYVMTHSTEMVMGPQGAEVLEDIFAFPLAFVALAAPLLAAWQMDRRTTADLQEMAQTLKTEALQRKLMERSLIAFTLRLAPGVTGLGLTILRMEFFWVGVMGGASLVAMALTWPSTDRQEETLKQLQNPQQSKKK